MRQSDEIQVRFMPFHVPRPCQLFDTSECAHVETGSGGRTFLKITFGFHRIIISAVILLRFFEMFRC